MDSTREWETRAGDDVDQDDAQEDAHAAAEAAEMADDVDQDDDAGDAPAITGQDIAVTMNDGTSFVVAIENRDYLSWDMTAPRKKWNAQAQPFLFANWLAYSAAKRTGRFAGTFDGREDGSWWNSVRDVDQRTQRRVPPTR